MADNLLAKLKACINSTTASCGVHVCGVSVAWTNNRARIAITYTCAARHNASSGHVGVELASITPPDDDVLWLDGTVAQIESAVLDGAWRLGAWDVLRVVDDREIRWHFKPTWRSMRLQTNNDLTLDADGSRQPRATAWWPEPLTKQLYVYRMGRAPHGNRSKNKDRKAEQKL